MKSFYFIILLIAFNVACHYDQPENTGFAINGEILGADSSYAFLIFRENGQDSILDSTLIRNSKFSFENLKVDQSKLYGLRFGQSRKNRIWMFLENENVTLKGHLDSLSEMNVIGGELQKKYNSYKASLKPFDRRLDNLYKEYDEADSLGDLAKMSFLDSVYEDLNEERINHIKNLAFENGNNAFGPFLTLNSELSYNLELPEFEELYNSFDSSLSDNIYYQKLEERIKLLRTIKVGATMPSFSQEDTSGNMINSDEFRGKYLLIDFWASWCGPCRRENPNVVALYEELKDQGVGFEILGVSLDDNRDDWILAIEEDGLLWPQVSDLKGWSNEVSDLYAINSIPHTVLVDPNGKIIAHKLRGEELKVKLESLLMKPN